MIIKHITVSIVCIDLKYLLINVDNIEYFSFDITNREIADLLNVKFQTTLLIFENNKEIYRSLGETTKELIYDAIKSSI